MDILKKLFPQAFKCKKSDTNNFVVTLIVYIVMFVIAGVLMWIAGFLTGIPVLGALVAIALRILDAVVLLYTVIGIVLSILCYAEIIE